MKAAAEGKKKEAAKKATMSSSMTQSSIMPSEVSPSRYYNIHFTESCDILILWKYLKPTLSSVLGE